MCGTACICLEVGVFLCSRWVFHTDTSRTAGSRGEELPWDPCPVSLYSTTLSRAPDSSSRGCAPLRVAGREALHLRQGLRFNSLALCQRCFHLQQGLCRLPILRVKSTDYQTYRLVLPLVKSQPVKQRHHLDWSQTGNIVRQAAFCEVPGDKGQRGIFT